MKSTSRKFLKCMFCCSNADISPEHIFGKAFSDKFTDQPNVHVKRGADIAVDTTLDWLNNKKKLFRGGGGKPLEMTSHSMCYDCNHRFGTEVALAGNALAKLCKGKTDMIPKSQARTTLRYLHRIGALVDLEACAFDENIMTENSADIEANRHYARFPPILSADQRRELLDGGLIDAVSVYVGRHKGRMGNAYCIDTNLLLGVGKTAAHNDDNERAFAVTRRLIFSIKKATFLIVIGNADINWNEKLEKFSRPDEMFKFNRRSVSNDSDVKKNLSSTTTHLDGSTSPF